jgi:hypothetical protein
MAVTKNTHERCEIRTKAKEEVQLKELTWMR